jgi:hypothetical protein
MANKQQSHGTEDEKELGLEASKRAINPLTNRPYTRSDASSGKNRSRLGVERAVGSSQGGVYVPVKSLVSVGGSLGSRGRRDEHDHDHEQEDGRRSRSRSTEVRRIPGLSRERPRSESRSRSGSRSRREVMEVSAWSSSDESDSSFQSTPKSRTGRTEWTCRVSRSSVCPNEEEDEDDDEGVITGQTSPSPASGSSRGNLQKDVAQVIDYSLPLRSPTVFPVSYKVNQTTGEKTERKLARGAKVQALGLGLTAMTITPASSAPSSASGEMGTGTKRPKSASSLMPSRAPSFVDALKNASSSELGSAPPTPAESEDSFAAIAPSPLWTPSVNPLIRGRNTATTADGASLAAGEQPFWSIGANVPLVSRKGMFRRTMSGLSASRWDVDNDCEAPVEDEADDGLVSDGRDVGFIDALLEDYQLAHPPTPAAMPRSNSYLGKAFGMTQMRPTMGRGGSYASDKENRNLQVRSMVAVSTTKANADNVQVQHVETRSIGAMAMSTLPNAPIPSPKARRNHSDGSTGTATSPDSERRMFRMVRKLTFQRPHHKDGRGKGRGGNWHRECGEAI